MKIALVHDYLREYGGAERVLEVIHDMWPTAPLYTSFVDWPSFARAPAGKGDVFKSWDIRTSWVQHYWLVKKFISPLRFLAPWIWGSFDLSGYDVVISSSGWFMCRGVALNRSKTLSRQSHETPHASQASPARRDDQAMHICYIHHPPRNLYGYATGSDLQKYRIVRVYAGVVNFFLRHYDWETAQAVDYFIANSKETARRVQKFYRRESTVIYPPIEITQGQAFFAKRSYFLSVGRLTYSKRVDLAIGACKKLGLSLKIVGAGKEEEFLKKLASQACLPAGRAIPFENNIEFLGSVSDEELGRLYAGAKALIFCALDEDFGMVPVEAMAHGTPVIGLAQGGVVETVVDGKTGVLFSEPTVASLVDAIRRFGKLGGPSFAPKSGASAGEVGKWEESCKKQAEKFGKKRFQKELRDFVEAHLHR